MAWVLYLFSSSLSVFSAFVMGYLALKAEIAPWVAPIISVVIILILLQLVSGDWFKKMAIAAISAGSIGGMIGMCLAWTSAYFLHQIEFANWISSPFKFAGTISFFVLIAGALAFLIAIPLYFSLVVPGRLKFPMSRLVYEVIYAKNKLMMFGKVIIGLISSMVYNFLLYFSHVPLNAYLPQLQIAPVFLAIGFISGQAIVIPILMGLLLRFFTATIIRDYYFYFDMKHDFIFAFASGMLIAVFVIELLLFVWLAIFSKNENKIDMEKFKKIFNFSDYKLYKFFFVVTILLGMLFFAHWNLSALQQIYVFLLIFFIGNGIAKIVGRIGIVDITSFVALIIMPYTYFFYSSTLSMLIISSFSAISLGVLTALLFSFKVGELAKIKYENMFKYLIASFVVVSALSGVIFYWYAKYMVVVDNLSSAEKIFNLHSFLAFNGYNYKIIILGVVAGILLRFISREILTMISGFIMPVSISVCLVISGAASYLVKKRERHYPIWFGVYAFHALWLFLRSFL